MKRRSFLAFAALPVAIGSAAAMATKISPQDRLQSAIEELKAAAMAAHPGLVEKWTVKVEPKMGCPVLIAGFTA